MKISKSVNQNINSGNTEAPEEGGQDAVVAAMRIAFEADRQARQEGADAMLELQASARILAAAIQGGSGGGKRAAAILWSLWNGELCDNLSGLSSELIRPLLAAIRARAYLSGDADPGIREILEVSGEMARREAESLKSAASE